MGDKVMKSVKELEDSIKRLKEDDYIDVADSGLLEILNNYEEILPYAKEIKQKDKRIAELEKENEDNYKKIVKARNKRLSKAKENAEIKKCDETDDFNFVVAHGLSDSLRIIDNCYIDLIELTKPEEG